MDGLTSIPTYPDYGHVPSTPQLSSSSTSSSFSYDKTLSPNLCYTSGSRRPSAGGAPYLSSAGVHPNSQAMDNAMMQRVNHMNGMRPFSSMGYHQDAMLSSSRIQNRMHLHSLDQNVQGPGSPQMKLMSSSALTAGHLPHTSLSSSALTSSTLAGALPNTGLSTAALSSAALSTAPLSSAGLSTNTLSSSGMSVLRPNTTLGFSNGNGMMRSSLRHDQLRALKTQPVEEYTASLKHDAFLQQESLDDLYVGASLYSELAQLHDQTVLTNPGLTAVSEEAHLSALSAYNLPDDLPSPAPVLHPLMSLSSSSMYTNSALQATAYPDVGAMHGMDPLDDLANWQLERQVLLESMDSLMEQQLQQQQQILLMNQYMKERQMQAAAALQQRRLNAECEAYGGGMHKTQMGVNVQQTMASMQQPSTGYRQHQAARRPLSVQVPSDVPCRSVLMENSSCCTMPSIAQAFDDDDQSTGAGGGWSNMPSPYLDTDFLKDQAGRHSFLDQDTPTTLALLAGPCDDSALRALLDGTELERNPEQGGPAQEDPEISYQTLSQVWMKPIQVAASELGVSKFRLKKVCNNYNIQRWPHRKIKCLQNLVIEMEEEGADQGDVQHVKQQLAAILCNPAAPLDNETKRQLRVYAKKRFVQKHGSSKSKGLGDAYDDANAGEDEWA